MNMHYMQDVGIAEGIELKQVPVLQKQAVMCVQ